MFSTPPPIPVAYVVMTNPDKLPYWGLLYKQELPDEPKNPWSWMIVWFRMFSRTRNECITEVISFRSSIPIATTPSQLADILKKNRMVPFDLKKVYGDWKPPGRRKVRRYVK